MAKDQYKYFRIEARELLEGLSQAVLDLERGERGKDLVLLDTRIQRMPYGKIFLESLPRYKKTHELADVRRFLSGPDRE